MTTKTTKTTTKTKKIEPDATFVEIFDRIKSDQGIIFVDTPEETRLIRALFRNFTSESVQFWSVGFGLHEIDRTKMTADSFFPYKFEAKFARNPNDIDTKTSINNVFSVIELDSRTKVGQAGQPIKKHIYILRDLDKFLKDPILLRRLKDLVYLCNISSSCIVVTGYGLSVPTDLEKDSAFIKLKYPSKNEILNGTIKDLRNKIKNYNGKPGVTLKIDDSFNDDDVARACTGLTEDQILNTLQLTMTVNNKICIDKILEEKKAIINKSDILEYWICDDSLDDIGGFGEIKPWFDIKKAIITNPEKAAAFKADQPKGMMLLGVQGSGKTAIAKALAKSWNVGLIKLDIGKVFAGLVGESEKRMRQALTQMDAAGGIVVIDEIDKALSGAGSSDKTDGGTTSRVIGTLLTWLSEDHPGVFLIATANDITGLLKNHPELFRKGRFDEIWFSDVPTLTERKDIFKIHLNKRGRDPKKLGIDLDVLAKYEFEDHDGTTYTFTGAEIESSIKDAIQAKLSELLQTKKAITIGKNDITTEDILHTLTKIKPITKVAKGPINTMRKWSADNARNVSIGCVKEVTDTKTNSNLNLRVDPSEIEI